MGDRRSWGASNAAPSYTHNSLHELELRRRILIQVRVAGALRIDDAEQLLADLDFAWIRKSRFPERAPDVQVLHLAGPVIKSREWRHGWCYVVAQRQSCLRCGRPLMHAADPCENPWYTVGGDVREYARNGFTELPDDLDRPIRLCVVAPRPKAPGLKLVGYLRVSTARQAAEGFGLEVQREAIATWSRANKAKVVEYCTDAGKSGADDVLDRPALGQCLQHLSRGRADGIIVARLDRLARDLVIQEQVLAEIRRLGGRTHSVDAGEDELLVDDPADATRKLVRRVLGAVAEHERDVIRLRMRAGKAAKLEAGGYAHGRPPYGWRAAGRTLVEDPAEQLVVKEIRRLHRRGRSLREIAQELAAQGVQTRAGNAWSPSSVSAVIRRV